MNWLNENTEYYSANIFQAMEHSNPDKWRCFQSNVNSASLIKAVPTFQNVAVIISSGGSNGPLVHGYVGDGLADAAVVGGPFGAPNAYCLYETAKYLGKEKGVLFLCNNFAGDYLNNDMARELLELEGYRVQNIYLTDDIATAIGEPKEQRNGRCGIALIIKIAGQCAKAGMDLDEIVRVVKKASDRLATLSAHVDFDKKEISYGGGISGEPGFRFASHMEQQELVKDAADLLLADLKPQAREKLVLLVNRLRLTSYCDSYLIGQLLFNELGRRHPTAMFRVGAYSNVRDVYGLDFSILSADDELLGFLNPPVYTDCFMI